MLKFLAGRAVVAGVGARVGRALRVERDPDVIDAGEPLTVKEVLD
jgi:hypothetical protein